MTEQYINQNRNAVIAILVGALTVLLVLMISFIFSFNLVQNLVLGWIFTTIYAVFAFFLIGDSIRTIEKRVFVDKPFYVDRPVEVEKIKEVIREVPIQIPVENRTIEVVDRPVYRDRVQVVKSPTRKLNIPKYNFVASSQEKRYHTRNCRLGKLIKNKFKVHSNSQAFFKRKKYKACKMCIKKLNTHGGKK